VPLFRRPVRLSRRVLVVLAVQAIALGVLATGALGTSKDGPQAPATPQVAVATSVQHDTTGALADLPVIANDPNRVIPEFERQTQPSVAVAPHDAVAQTAVAGPAVPGTSGVFNGLKFTDLSAGYVPPDTVGDVGPTQFVQAVNGGLDVFSKTGDNLTGAINDSSFWNGLPGCAPTSTRGVVDPTLNYDQYGDAWVYSALSIDFSTPTYGQSYMCIAVSATGDATGSWNRYVFAAGNGVFPDYPKLGVWPDGYYLSFNDFSNAPPHNFVGAGAMVVERNQMLAGNTAQSVFMDLSGVSGVLNGGMLPADADGPTQPDPGTPNYYVVAVDDPTNVNDQLGVWAFHVDWATPANSTFTNPQALNVAAFDGYTQRSVAQPGTSQLLDGLSDDRLMNRVQYRNFGTHETLVTNLTTDNGSGGLAPRWFELRKAAGSWSVNQQSTFAPTAVNRWMGSVAMDGAGDMALGYSAGDASTAPELRYTGRLVGDSLSTMEPEGTLAGGGGSQTGTNRWGDYSQMSVDPTDDCTFWYTGEFYSVTSANSWQTRIGSFRFPSCTVSTGPTYSVVPTISGTRVETNILTATPGTWSPAPLTTAYQWQRCDASGVFCSNIAGAATSTYLLVADDAGRRIRVKVSVTAATGASSIVSAGTTTILPVPPVNFSTPSVSGTTQVASTLSGTQGVWQTYVSTPTTYTYQWERCVLSCTAIPGATSSSYTLVAADAGAKIKLGVTGNSIGGTTLAYSALTGVVTLPPPPVNTVAPSISGTTRAGSLLTLDSGTWTGAPPIFGTYQWQSCTSTGTNCSDIGGQTSGTYTLNSGDIGRTVRVAVTATNSGGGTLVNTSATSVIAAAATGGGGGGSGGGGSGGGGGGTGGSLDLSITGYQTPANPLVGDNVSYVLSADDLTSNQLAQNVVLNVTLPAGVSYVTSYADRGSGCAVVSSSQLRCFLDFLSGAAPHANILITAKVVAGGTHVLTATLTAQQSESTLANNTLTLTYLSGAAGTTIAPLGLNGDTAPRKAQDKKKPTVHALVVSAKRGAVAKLRFKIYDDKGTAKAMTTVKRGTKVIGKANTGYGPVAYGSVYYVGWHVPAKAAKGKYTFCVVAVDRAGNKSAPSCAPVALK
jgi:hypothetical protein